MSMESADEEGSVDIFKEPEDFYELEKQPTFVSYETLSGQVLSLRLIGHSPLWGHLLWNAGRVLARHLEANAESVVRDRTVLELGAGAGLPSLICALCGAKQVVVTDYPDADLVENLQYNVDQHLAILRSPPNISAQGYLWGAPVSTLISYLPVAEQDQGFDLLILGDLLFNHSEHGKLVSTLQQTLRKTPSAQALVFFTPYRPWLLQKDLAFFDLARQAGFVVENLLEQVMDDVMFEDDPGDEVLRRTVFGYSLRWQIQSHETKTLML